MSCFPILISAEEGGYIVLKNITVVIKIFFDTWIIQIYTIKCELESNITPGKPKKIKFSLEFINNGNKLPTNGDKWLTTEHLFHFYFSVNYCLLLYVSIMLNLRWFNKYIIFISELFFYFSCNPYIILAGYFRFRAIA